MLRRNINVSEHSSNVLFFVCNDYNKRIHKQMLFIWTQIPMDMVYEILEFSNHAKLRNLVLMYKIPETDPRLQMQIKPIKKKSVVLPMPNDKKMEISFFRDKLNYCVFKIKNNIPQLVQIHQWTIR
jgi:hypothetical protein